MVKKKLTLAEQAAIEEKKIRIEQLNKADTTDNVKLLRALLPDYKPQPKQKRFHMSNAYEKGLKGGYGAGKTIALCAEAIAMAFVNMPAPVVLSSVTEDVIEETTYATLKELCEDNQLQLSYNESKNLFTILFGQEKKQHGRIYLIGQKFYKGPNIAAVGFDEPFSQRKSTYENLIARVRNKKAKRLQIFWSGTAEPDKMEWGFDYFKKDYNDEKLFTVTISTDENKFATKEYVNSLKDRYDAKTQEVYLKGKYLLLTSLPVYSAFSRDRNVMQDYALRDYDEVILSFDFNVDPLCAALIVLKKTRAYQVKEWSISGSNTKEMCAAVIAYLNEAFSKHLETERSIIITGDASGKRRDTRSYRSDYEIIRDEFSKAGIKYSFALPKENPAVRDRVNFVNKLFESELFFIAESCEKSIRDRELVSWKQGADGFFIDKSKKDLTHLSDAADYGVYNCQVLLSSKTGSMVDVESREGRHNI